MKKVVTLVLSLMLVSSVMASDKYEINYERTSNGHALELSLKDYGLMNQTHNGQTFTTIKFEAVKTDKKGFAELPLLHSSVQIDATKDYEVKVVGSKYEDIKLSNPLLPSKGVVKRNVNISKLPYEVSPASIVDAFYPSSIVTSSQPFIFRDVRGMNVYFHPFAYNAAKKVLRVYKSLKVELVSNSRSSTNALRTKTSPNAVMNGIYKSMFVNYMSPSRLKVAEFGEILVITTARDEAAIQPYIEWKTQKGYAVHKRVVAKGSNVASLVKTEYAQNNKLLYVQLVGDWEDIKSDIGPDSAPMDPMLGAVVGKDAYAELMVGRFSAKSPADVTVQVNKTINYEKNPDLNGSWYKNTMAIGSSEGNGNGDDGESDYAHLRNIFNYKLNPTTYDFFFDMTAPTNSTKIDVKDHLDNDGVGLINYAGHGSHSAWSTTGFSNTNVKQLKNDSRLPMIISVACVNGEFHTQWGGDAFAEAWLKKENGGAIVMWAATINQPWAPPMRGQDYFNDLLIGGYNYDKGVGKGTNTNEGRTTFGALAVNASHLMYAEKNGYADLETVQTWTIFGDASLQVRSDAPQAYDISHTIATQGASLTATIASRAGEPVKNAIVSLSQKGKSFAALTNEQGQVNLTHDLKPGAYKMTVTGFNLETKVVDGILK